MYYWPLRSVYNVPDFYFRNVSENYRIIRGEAFRFSGLFGSTGRDPRYIENNMK